MLLDRLIAGYTRLLRVIAGTTMSIIVVVMVVQVVARYVFNGSLIWAEELCRYLLIWQTFLYVGMAYQRGELVSVEVVPLMLSPRVRFALKVLVTVPALTFLWLMMTNGYDYAGRFSNQVIPAIDFISTSLIGKPVGLSIFWVYISVPIGCLLLGLHLIASLAIDWRALLARHRHGERAGGH
ncbi:MAG: TRAP transporter small permease [Rhodobiaceae bacterium]|nr:TRAP transporter small permease [Rhodobiaceae bacterium]MCC0014759.1 TRAP transporter small permease [Rhodobiaceae bacterium]MCC0041387.1 TRAP transporter small permease [Rhodobiaceae bacterium]MCC0054264.1 TRAP transporter small permease [Rhodobiaceae bacterium]